MTNRALAVIPVALFVLFGCGSDDATPIADSGVTNDALEATTAKYYGVVVGVRSELETISGATISVRDTSPLTQFATDENGQFETQLPFQQTLVVDVEAEGYIPSVKLIDVPEEGRETFFTLYHPDNIDYAISQLDAPARDPSKGIVVVSFLYEADFEDTSELTVPITKGGELVRITADYETVYALDLNSTPHPINELPANYIGSVRFVNVDVGTTQIVPSGGCSTLYPSNTKHPVEANKVTWVGALCGDWTLE